VYIVNSDVVVVLFEKVVWRYTVFPLQKIGIMFLVVLVVFKDLAVLDDLCFALGCEIQTVLVFEDEIIGAFNCYYCDEWMLDIV